MAGLTSLAAIIEGEDLDATAVQQRQIIANCQRDDFTPPDKARGIKELMERTSGSAADVASKLGFTRGTVAKLLALADLPELIQTQIRHGKIPATAGYELSRIADAGEQEELAEKLASAQLTRDALSGIVKRHRSPRTGDTPKNPARVRIELSSGRSITLAGAGLDGIDGLIGWIEELLRTARRLRPKGLSLATFVRLLKDEAKE